MFILRIPLLIVANFLAIANGFLGGALDKYIDMMPDSSTHKGYF